MAVKVQFKVGHTSKLRSKKTVEGFTHDWELYVEGDQQADISAFVEKIVFNLHESFPKPKRVCKEPPYLIQESGYAGFMVFIDVYFRNKDEPKRVPFTYDLDLQTTGPPRHRSVIMKYIFDNPSEEFRLKLLRGGGIPVTGVLGSNAINSAVPGGVACLPPSHTEPHKISSSEKKHKSRPDDSKLNSFADLFGPPITKSAPVGNVGGGGIAGPGAGSYASGGNNKHSPDAKIAAHQPISNPGNNLPPPKEKSSKDKDKSSEKSKERSEKKEKHHKSQSGTSPHKEGRSESKKSESKHEKRDRNEEKSSKKDKNRDKDRDRDREKSSSANASNLTSSNNKRPISPKPSKDLSSALPGGGSTLVNNSNTVAGNRPSSSQSGKLEEVKSSSKSSKESSGDGKSKESKQKESSSSSGKKSKKDKKDKDKERDKERRHEEKEKQKLLDASSKSVPKEDQKPSLPPNNVNLNQSANLTTSGELKPAKNAQAANASTEITKKLDKSSKQESGKLTEKVTVTQSSHLTTAVPASSSSSASVSTAANDKKSSSSNPPEKDKRSHKHKKKEKNRDKDKGRERDKEREKDKEKDRDKDKDKDKESRKEKDTKEKLVDERNSENFSVPPALQGSLNMPANLINSPHIGNTEEPPSINTTPSSSTSSTTTSSSSKSSKNKDKKSKDKSKEDKLKRKSNGTDSAEAKAKQSKLSSSSTSTSSSSTTTPTSATTSVPQLMPPVPSSLTTTAASNSTHLDLSDNDSASSTPTEPTVNNTTVTAPTASAKQTSNSATKLPPITHSDSSNSSFPDLSLPQKSQKPSQPELIKPISQSMSTPPPPIKDPPTKTNKSSKDKASATEKSSKGEEKEKKRRRNSQAANTFIEPPLKQVKKDQTKSVREKSKSPLLRNTGTRASISEPPSTFLQPGASPSGAAAAAPLPPPSSAPSAAHSPALSATEAVGNATSATANAATCNSNSTTTSNSNSLASHQLPLDYLSELQELHHKIMTLQDNEDLQHVVEMIAATGCYEITTKTFDFDLCKLDRVTVQRLQEFFATSVS